MASVFSITKQSPSLAIIRSRGGTLQAGTQAFKIDDLNPTVERFNEFWDMMETIEKHGYLRAAMSVVGRSTIGAWWSFRRHPIYGKNASERNKKRLYEFYMMNTKQWDNIKDYQNLSYKLMIAVMYLRYFGQAAFNIIRDKEGNAVGFDFLHGLVVPNVDSSGRFKTTAFVQYISSDASAKIEFKNQRDIVYLVNPDWEGSPLGGSDIEALSEYTLPLDIYLQTAARDYMKNRDKPEVVYSLPPDISDEAFDTFVRELEARQSGASNLGRNPIAVQGEFDIKELRPLPDALPYQDSRKDAREEVLAVTGVAGAKLGLSESISSANLRELRREFHETTLVPLFTTIEIAFYEQIHVREFGIPQWEFKFNRPDFLNAVEKATVHMRYRQIGVLNANEIRSEIGYEPREDEQGDDYEGQEVEDANEEEDNPIQENPQGSPPEGREGEPDDPSQIGEPTLDDQDPPRGDQHNDQPRESILRELKTWKAFSLKRLKRGKIIREFRSDVIGKDIRDIISYYLSRAETIEEVAQVFDDAIDEIGGLYGS